MDLDQHSGYQLVTQTNTQLSDQLNIAAQYLTLCSNCNDLSMGPLSVREPCLHLMCASCSSKSCSFCCSHCGQHPVLPGEIYCQACGYIALQELGIPHIPIDLAKHAAEETKKNKQKIKVIQSFQRKKKLLEAFARSEKARITAFNKARTSASTISTLNTPLPPPGPQAASTNSAPSRTQSPVPLMTRSAPTLTTLDESRCHTPGKSTSATVSSSALGHGYDTQLINSNYGNSNTTIGPRDSKLTQSSSLSNSDPISSTDTQNNAISRSGADFTNSSSNNGSILYHTPQNTSNRPTNYSSTGASVDSGRISTPSSLNTQSTNQCSDRSNVIATLSQNVSNITLDSSSTNDRVTVLPEDTDL